MPLDLLESIPVDQSSSLIEQVFAEHGQKVYTRPSVNRFKHEYLDRLLVQQESLITRWLALFEIVISLTSRDNGIVPRPSVCGLLATGFATILAARTPASDLGIIAFVFIGASLVGLCLFAGLSLFLCRFAERRAISLRTQIRFVRTVDWCRSSIGQNTFMYAPKELKGVADALQERIPGVALSIERLVGRNSFAKTPVILIATDTLGNTFYTVYPELSSPHGKMIRRTGGQE